MKKNIIAAMIFSIAGVLFSGYLTVSKLILGYCPLSEPCPFLWGYPVCVYGLILFITILLITLTLLAFPEDSLAKALLIYVSALGVLFALVFTHQEVFITKCPGGCTYTLGLPTCIYGLVMFTIVLYNSIKTN